MPRTPHPSYKTHPDCKYLIEWSDWCSLKRKFIDKAWICPGCQNYESKTKKQEKNKKKK